MKKINDDPNFYKDIDIIHKKSGSINSDIHRTYHECFRIYYFDTTDGFLIYDGNEYQIKQSQTIIIRPNTVYTLDNIDGDVLYYDFQFLDKKSSYNCKSIFLNEYIFDIEKQKFLRNIFYQVLEEDKDNLGASKLFVSGLGLTLLALIFRSMKGINIRGIASKEVSRPNIFLLSEIETKLNEDFAYYCNITNLCYGIGISENKLYKLIKETYGISPKDWISDIKIERIKVRLVERVSVYDLSEELGFSSLSYMFRFFKQRTNQTINEYLKGYSNK